MCENVNIFYIKEKITNSALFVAVETRKQTNIFLRCPSEMYGVNEAAYLRIIRIKLRARILLKIW
jgi:hypothetical protein